MQIKTDAIIEKAAKLAEGEVEFVVSTNALDAYGERIDVEGINLKDYKKNPVVLWGHDGFNLPIGKATKIWKDGQKLMARAKFNIKDDFPRKVYEYIMDGFLNAVSIGGMVDQWSDDYGTIEKMTMKEFSVVSMPANPEALVTAKSLDNEASAELRGLANAYARKCLEAKGGVSGIKKEIEVLEGLVATLKEVADVGETNGEQATTRRVVLRSTQAVDKQAEKIIINLKKQEVSNE